MAYLFLDPILPSDLNIGLRIFIHILVAVHAVAFIYWVILLVKSATITPEEKAKQQQETKASRERYEKEWRDYQKMYKKD